MKKTIFYFLILIVHSEIAFSQDTFKDLNFENIALKLFPNSYIDNEKNRLLVIDKCSNNDTLVIQQDTLFNFSEHNEEKALFIFTQRNQYSDDCHACSPTTGFFFLKKMDNKEWEYEVGKFSASKLGEWGYSPKYKLLKTGENEHSLLVEYDGLGNQGFFYYSCELISLYFGKVFSLNSLNDTTGAKEEIESIELKKMVYTKKNEKGEYLLCVQSKGHIEKKVKVNRVDFYKYNEEHNFYLPAGKINLLSKK